MNGLDERFKYGKHDFAFGFAQFGQEMKKLKRGKSGLGFWFWTDVCQKREKSGYLNPRHFVRTSTEVDGRTGS